MAACPRESVDCRNPGVFLPRVPGCRGCWSRFGDLGRRVHGVRLWVEALVGAKCRF